jgi:hypothetical protein
LCFVSKLLSPHECCDSRGAGNIFFEHAERDYDTNVDHKQFQTAFEGDRCPLLVALPLGTAF